MGKGHLCWKSCFFGECLCEINAKVFSSLEPMSWSPPFYPGTTWQWCFSRNSLASSRDASQGQLLQLLGRTENPRPPEGLDGSPGPGTKSSKLLGHVHPGFVKKHNEINYLEVKIWRMLLYPSSWYRIVSFSIFWEVTGLLWCLRSYISVETAQGWTNIQGWYYGKQKKQWKRTWNIWNTTSLQKPWPCETNQQVPFGLEL